MQFEQWREATWLRALCFGSASILEFGGHCVSYTLRTWLYFFGSFHGGSHRLLVLHVENRG
jgi:hypothetical protein